MPYSTKLRPHLPHGCMPTPATTTSALIRPPPRPPPNNGAGYRRRSCAGSDRAPLPDDVFAVGVTEQLFDHELDLLSDLQVVDGVAVGDLTEDHHLLVGEFDGRDGEGLEVLAARDVGRRRLVLRIGEGPDPAEARELGLLELLPRTGRIAAEERRLGEEHRAAGRAPVAQQGRLVVGGEPAVDRGETSI